MNDIGYSIVRDPPAIVFSDERWSVLLSSDYTMVELVAMMSGLRIAGINVEAFPLDGGVMLLHPELPHHAPPSAAFLLECMQMGKCTASTLTLQKVNRSEVR